MIRPAVQTSEDASMMSKVPSPKALTIRFAIADPHFVLADEARVTRHIGCEDGGELPFDRGGFGNMTTRPDGWSLG